MALLWLARKAAFQAVRVTRRDQVYQLDRGELIFAYRDAIEAWDWPKDSAARFLKKMELLGVLKLRKASHLLRAKDETTFATDITLVTVCIISESGEEARHGRDSAASTKQTNLRQKRADYLKEKKKKEEEKPEFDVLNRTSPRQSGDPVKLSELMHQEKFKEWRESLEKKPPLGKEQS
jgi:hypothetical protein